MYREGCFKEFLQQFIYLLVRINSTVVLLHLCKNSNTELQKLIILWSPKLAIFKSSKALQLDKT